MDVREMRIFSADQIDVPQALPKILKDFSKEVIRNNPENLVEFCRDYFIQAIKERDAQKAAANKPAPSVAKPVVNKKGLDIQHIAEECAKSAMDSFDGDKNGKLSKAEAEPMFRVAFEGLKETGKIPKDFEWSKALFADGFKQVDVDNSGSIEMKELTRFAVFLMTRLLE